MAVDGGSPAPATLTVSPPASPVEGVTVTDGAATAEAADTGAAATDPAASARHVNSEEILMSPPFPRGTTSDRAAGTPPHHSFLQTPMPRGRGPSPQSEANQAGAAVTSIQPAADCRRRDRATERRAA